MKKSFATPLLLAGAAALAWWWWKGRAGAGGKDPAAVDAGKGVQIGQAGSNIGLTGDQVGSLFDKLLEQSAPYDEVRIQESGDDRRRVYQVRKAGTDNWIQSREESTVTNPSPMPMEQFCQQYGLNCRP